MEVTPNLEDADQALLYLSPGIQGVRTGLDHGVSLADSFFSDIPHDPWLWSHIARYETRRYLDSVEPVEWERGRPLANSGIEVKRIPLVLRTLKARGDAPPHPGSNEARRAFWSQRVGRPRLPIKVGGAVIPETPNFILDWSVNKQRDIFLALSKPIGTWKYGQHPKLEWRRPVEPEGENLRFAAPPDEDLPVENVFDPQELGETGDSSDGASK